MAGETPATATREGQIYGKVVASIFLCVAGAAALHWQGAIVGLIVGIAIGQWIDQRISQPPEEKDTPAPTAVYDLDHEANRRLAGEVALPFAALAQALGKQPAAAEGALWRFYRDGLGVAALGAATAREALGAAGEIPMAVAVERAAALLPPERRRPLVVALHDLARDLGAAAGPARLALHEAAGKLGVAQDEETAIRAAAFADDGALDYRLLGIAEGASDAEVRAAFRSLEAKLQPDVIAALGKRAVELAEAELSAARGAYDRIRAARGG